MIEPQGEQLSPAGVARREAMLEELVETVRQTRRTRRMQRRLTAGTGCAVVALLLIRLALPGAGPANQRHIAAHSPDHTTAVRITGGTPGATVIVHTDDSILERCRAAPADRIVRIDDQALIRTHDS